MKKSYFTVKAEVTDLRSKPSWDPYLTNGHDRHRESQVLHGTCLHAIGEQNGWVEVEVPSQEVGHAKGDIRPYRGWVFGDLLSESSRCSCVEAVCVGDLIERAKSYLDYPYLWGGIGGCEGIDCSALVYQAYLAKGIVVPRNSSDQFVVGRQVSPGCMVPGDLVFVGTPIWHVLIWDGKVLIEATDLGEGVVRLISFEERFGMPIEEACEGEFFFRRLLPPAARPA